MFRDINSNLKRKLIMKYSQLKKLNKENIVDIEDDEMSSDIGKEDKIENITIEKEASAVPKISSLTIKKDLSVILPPLHPLKG